MEFVFFVVKSKFRIFIRDHSPWFGYSANEVYLFLFSFPFKIMLSVWLKMKVKGIGSPLLAELCDKYVYLGIHAHP